MPFIPALYSSSREGHPIDMLVLHYTAGPSLAHCVELFRRPDRPVSCHYVVGIDGEMVQMVYDHDCAWHCGVSAWNGRDRCNPRALGIEIANWGLLEKHDEQFFCWPGGYKTLYDGLPPVFAEDAWWAPYPEKQIEQVIALSRYLIERYKIPFENVVAHSDIAPVRKIDPGPAFPWTFFRARIQNQSA